MRGGRQEDRLHDLARRCAEVVRLYTIGRSVQGRELWALEVADAPGRLEAKPNVKYVANMHGDEPSGRRAPLPRPPFLAAASSEVCGQHARRRAPRQARPFCSPLRAPGLACSPVRLLGRTGDAAFTADKGMAL